MNKPYLDKVSFNRIRYANCWEDTDILLEALKINTNDIVLSIGSGGDNSLSLLAQSPKKVIVYDVSEVQLHLIALKKVSFTLGDHQTFLAFLGFRPMEQRGKFYQQELSNLLSDKTRQYWDNNLHLIEKGVIYAGKFEQYFRLYRRFIQPLLVSKSSLKEFFNGPPTAEQVRGYNKRLSNPVSRAIFSLFFGRRSMALLGRSPAFFNEVHINVADYLLNSFKHFLDNKNSYKNYYMHFIAKGYFPHVLPHYAREESFQKIKENLHKLELNQGYLQEAFHKEKGITAMNASDIFEYQNAKSFSEFAQDFSDSCAHGTRIAYWNLMVDRMLSNELACIHYDKKTSDSLTLQDKLFFYKRFVCETLIK